jgi:hypothetical protein
MVKLKKMKIIHLSIIFNDSNNFSTIQSHVVQFYKDLFGKGEIVWGAFSVDVWKECEKITIENNSFLTASFTEDEIHTTVFSTAPDKTAGPNGFFLLGFISVFGT